jgi:hypothetical protein
LWGCKKHWYALPSGLRDRIWKAYRPGQETDKRPSKEYLEAVRVAEAWILKHHPPGSPAPRQRSLL